MVENHHPGLWAPLTRRPVLAGALLLCLLSVMFFWKLSATEEFMWMDSPDLANQVLPWWNYQAREWHAGRFPAWEPHQWAGQPLIGQAQPGAAYPLNWLLFLTPLKDGKLRQGYMDAYWILLHYIAAFNAFLLCLELRRSWLASILGGCLFGFLGYVGNVNWPQMVGGVIWAPLVFKYILRASRGHRPWVSSGLAGFFLGFCWLAGHHQVPTFLTYTALILWMYLAYSSADWRRYIRFAAVFLGLFFATSALQTLPSYEYGKQARRWVGARDTVDWKTRVPYNVHGQYSMRPIHVFGLVMPNFSEGYAGFIGVTGFTLSLLALCYWSEDRWTRVFAAMAAGGLVVALGVYTPLHAWLYSWAPLFEKARSPAAAIAIFNLGALVLVAAGFDRLLRPESRELLPKFRLGLGLLGGLIALIYFSATVVKGLGTVWDERGLTTAFVAGALCLLLTALHRQRVGVSALAAGLIFLMLTEGNHTSTHGYISKDIQRNDGSLPATLLHDDVVGYLRTLPKPYRVWVDDKAVAYNFGDFHGIDSWGGYLASLSSNLLNVDANHMKIQAALGVTHHIGKEPMDAVKQKKIFSGASGVNVYENPGAMPRVWTVRTVFPVRNGAEANQALESDLDLHTHAFTIGPPPKIAMPAKTCGEDRVRLTRSHGGHVTIEAVMSCEGLVVLGDTYFPGWTGAIDGKPSAVYEVDGILRGMVVPEGKHLVTMDYRPASLILGASLSGLALVALAGLAWWDRRESGGAAIVGD